MTADRAKRSKQALERVHWTSADMIRRTSHHVDLLVLGAGWTSTFLLPLLESEGLTHAATTTTGRDGTIPFKFEPESTDTTPYQRLPTAITVLITFPLKGPQQSTSLTSLYRQTHPQAADPQFIQLGATSIWKQAGWSDCNAPYDKANERAVAEDELLSAPIHGAVLDLAGLWGGARQPRAWLTRVFKSKDDVRGKQALHLIHGADVARAIVAVHRHWPAAAGRRWLLTDLRTYDWWDLVLSWTATSVLVADDPDLDRKREIRDWVWECMLEIGVRAVPRGPEMLGRVLDARDFWKTMELLPTAPRA